MSVTHFQIEHDDETDAPPVYAEFSRKRWASQIKMLRKAFDAGVRIAAGTDSVIAGMQFYTEPELLVSALGVTPHEALLCATRNGAHAMRKAGEKVGTLEVGKYADLVQLAADPLLDISNIRKISAVVKGGDVVAVPGENPGKGLGGHRG